VLVEVQLAPGLPSFTLVGLADTEVKESRVSEKSPGAHRMQWNQWLSVVSDTKFPNF